MINAIYESKNDIAPDILFTHCGGKDRMPVIIKALRALKVSVVAIPDFDLINDSSKFKQIVDAFGVNWSDQLKILMQNVYDWLNANQNVKEFIKRSGKSVLDGQAAINYNNVEQVCRLMGLFIIPCGEMECFKKNNKSKGDWVYNELENSNLAMDNELCEARDFIQAVVDF